MFALKCLFISAALIASGSITSNVEALKYQTTCSLGTASSYVALFGAAFTNSQATTGTKVNGNLGMVGGSLTSGIGALTGFTNSLPTAGNGVITGLTSRDSPDVGSTGVTTGVAGVAWLSALAKFNQMYNLKTSTGVILNQALPSATLTSGVYYFNAALATPASMTLTLKGDGVYVFIVDGALNTGASNVINFVAGAGGATDLAKANCVYWIVRDAVNFGASSLWFGNVLAGAAINSGAGSSFVGMMWTKTGAATVDSSVWTSYVNNLRWTDKTSRCTACTDYTAKAEGDSGDAITTSDASSTSTSMVTLVATAATAAVVAMMQ